MSDISKMVENLSNLSVADMLTLVKQLEENWGVSAAAPVAAATSSGGSDAPAAEKSSFDVILTDAGASKINVIKEVRAIVAGLGLAEAKALVESAPKPIKTGVKKDEAEEIKKKFEAVGAKVDIQ